VRSAFSLVPLVAVLMLPACGVGVEVEASGATSGGAATPRAGSFGANCIPNAGPPTPIRLIIDSVGGCDGAFQFVSFIKADFWGPALADLHSGGTVTVSPELEGTDVLNTNNPGSSSAISEGTFLFDTYVYGASATGTYRLTLADGSIVQSAFALGWCPVWGQCG